jgi:hypothetical protein
VPSVVKKSDILKVTLSPSRGVIDITPFSGNWKPLPNGLTSSGSNASKDTLGDVDGELKSPVEVSEGSGVVALDEALGMGDELGLELKDKFSLGGALRAHLSS